KDLPSFGNDHQINLSYAGLTISRISATFAGCDLKVGLNASLSYGPVNFEVAGLGISVSLKAGDNFKVTPTLTGAGASLRQQAFLLDIAMRNTGALTGPPSLAGLVQLRIPGLERQEPFYTMLLAAGWTKNAEGWDSVFVYGELLTNTKYPSGLLTVGPVVFTGVALGFGVNSSLHLPRWDQLTSFPLLTRLDAAPPLPTDPQPDPLTPLAALDQLAGGDPTPGNPPPPPWITPALGQYWFTGGLQFSLFGYIDCRAQLFGEFGSNQWHIALMGRVSAAVPKSLEKPPAQVNIDFMLAFRSAENLLSMDVAIAPGSYVLDPACALTGGLALYVWTGGTRKGEFILTAGGYHPQFDVKNGYPRVARLGFVWNKSKLVTMKGECYAAVTNSAFMIGGELAVVFAAGGNFRIEAWAVVRAHALLQWKPFYADIFVGISLGIAATVKVLFIRVRVSIEIGVDLHIWFSEFGGRARVKLFFTSFTFDLNGSERKGSKPVGWNEFTMLLPAPIRVTPLKGIFHNDPGSTDLLSTSATLPVSADDFTVSTDTDIPASRITLNGRPPSIDGRPLPDDDPVAIRPMDLSGVYSEHKVEVWRNDVPFNPDLEGWTVEVIRRDVPASLWGEPLDDPYDAIEEEMLPDRMVGLRIAVPVPRPEGKVGPIASASVGVEGLPDGRMPLRDPDPVGPTPTADDGSVAVIADTILDPAPRSLLHDALFSLGVAPGSDGTLEHFAAGARTAFTDPPLTTTAVR
ncbi:DUF6603 domain-containing protein, partial [Streptomyces lavendulae]